MKFITLIFIIVLSSFSQAQSLNELKYDSIVKINNTDLSLIYFKKKMAVWHDANFFVAKPTKNYFIYLESAELLVEIDLKHQNFYAIVENQQFGGYKRFYIANNNFKASIYKNYGYEEKAICFDGYQRSILLEISDSTKCEFSNTNQGKFGIKFETKKLIITDKLNSDYAEDYGEVFIDSEGNDSIDNEGNTVYFPIEFIPGVANSGIFNIKTKQWLIQPKYSEIRTNNNYVLVSTELNSEKEFMDSTSYYQLFELNKNGRQLISKNKILDNDINVVSLMTKFDSIQQLDDKTHYITYKNGNQGLIEYQLFYTYFDIHKQYLFTEWIEFKNSEITSNQQDFIHFNSLQNAFITKKDSVFKIIKYEFIKSPKLIYSGTQKVKTEETPLYTEAELAYFNFGYNLINDSLLIIIDQTMEEYPFNYPLESDNFPGEDSLDANGELVYWLPDPGQYHCGMYNLNQNKWIIEPNEYDIQYFGGSHFIVDKPEFDENYLINTLGHYSLYDLNGKLIEHNINGEDLTDNTEYSSRLALQKNEKLESYNINYYANTNISDTLITAPYYYKIKNGEKERIVSLDHSNESINIDNISDYHHFVTYDPQSKFQFYLDNNNSVISFSIMEDSIETQFIEAENYKLEIYTVLDYEYMLSSLAILTTGKDTTLFEFGLKSEGENLNLIEDYKSRTNRVITITKVNNEIIYDVSNAVGEFYEEFPYIDNWENDVNGKQIKWEQEYSQIYRKMNNQWKTVSPHYSSIIQTLFGYICKTGGYYVENMEFYESIETIYVKNPSYIILDSTLKPIGYSDFYNFDLIEDLGFGYKVCPVVDEDNWNTSKGYGNCFFVNYNGKALCHAKFDRFELSEGKIYGIREEAYMLNEETGELMYEEYGDAIILQKYERVLIGEHH